LPFLLPERFDARERGDITAKIQVQHTAENSKRLLSGMD
jgi:hypothetical protein